MLMLHRLLCHSFQSKNVEHRSTVSLVDPEKDLTVVVWWAAFGASLFFQPAFKLIARVLFMLIGALVLGALDGLLSLTLGSAILASARCPGYDIPILVSMQAGILGGIAVTGPAILLLAGVLVFGDGVVGRCIVDLRLRALSWVLELSLSTATAAAGSLAGVQIVRQMDLATEVLDASRAARAGALGAIIIALPIVCIAAIFFRGRTAGKYQSTACPVSHLSE